MDKPNSITSFSFQCYYPSILTIQDLTHCPKPPASASKTTFFINTKVTINTVGGWGALSGAVRLHWVHLKVTGLLLCDFSFTRNSSFYWSAEYSVEKNANSTLGMATAVFLTASSAVRKGVFTS